MRVVRGFGSWLLGPGLLALCLGCSGSSSDGSGDRTISTAKYERACSVDADCAPVYEGSIGCCGGGCANAAINVASRALYLQDLEARVPVCNPAPPCAPLNDQVCGASATCQSHVCTFVSTF